MGAYHTLDLELNRKFTLGKLEWDSVSLERIGMCSLQVRVGIHIQQYFSYFYLKMDVLGTR